ncbi:hypothetical protein K0M31_002178 [Melipona bicolor]|uniref:Uncharacterized protein n=1 Tax=Melipona bicolor TaxID=60889 RepID=A0AA40GGZ3_9HYME|nr:hypothetical protein K0M31_002178 [Melipona bicolor]
MVDHWERESLCKISATSSDRKREIHGNLDNGSVDDSVVWEKGGGILSPRKVDRKFHP